MTRQRNDLPTGAADAAAEAANAVLGTPAQAGPQPNGDPVTPGQTAPTPRRPRDPDAPRPEYLVVARHRETGAIRVLMIEPTIGRAEKMAARCGHLVERDEAGPFFGQFRLRLPRSMRQAV